MQYWSDGNRLRGLLLGALLLAVPMGAWWYERVTVGIGYGQLLRDPVAADGVEFVLSLFIVTEVLDSARYVAVKGTDRFVVHGPTEGLLVGDTVSIGATWQARDQSIGERWREAHPRRGQKKLLGFAALGFLAVGMPLWIRLGDRGLEVRDG